MNIIFYDFEVFVKDWMVVFIDFETREKTKIINNPDQLRCFYEDHIDDIWVGYNSRNYDQYILKGILCGMNPYTVSKEMIENDKKGAQVVRKSNDFPLNNFDIATGFHGLKQLEGFMGSTIKESSVPFDITRKLTTDEIIEVTDYCVHDVEQTIEVFKNRREEFDSQLALIKAFDLPMDLFTKTKAQLAAIILGTNKSERDDEFELRFPDTLVIGEKYQYIVDWYKEPKNMNYKKSLVTDVAGVTHVFAWGGIHGAIPNYTDTGLLLCCDVASLYPSLMIEYGYISRNVTDPDRYKEMRDTRLQLKAEKNPMQLPYKIVLNSTYGAMKDKYNNLYDPLMANNVCIAGQLLLLDLIEKLEPYCKVIQSNTDGLFLKVEKEEDIDVIKGVAKEWETRTRLDLEWELCERIYQKDVNNYIIIDDKGKYKSKGAYVKKLTEIDYDLPIVNEALINYFISSKQPEDTINECEDLRKFQKIVKVSKLYKHALYGDRQVYEKVLRVFASNHESAQTVYKVKSVTDENGQITERLEKIANSPERCFIYNEDVRDAKIPDTLDKQYYVDIANKRLNDFMDASKTKKYKIPSDIKYVNNEVRDLVLNLLDECTGDFLDFLIETTEEKSINTKHLKVLTMLNYFEKFGKNKKLLQVIEKFEQLGSRKQIKFKDIEKMGINEDVLRKYAKSSTEIQYREIDMISYVREIIKGIDDKPLSIKQQIKFEIEYLGETNYINEKAGDDFYIIIDYQTFSDKTKPYIILRQVNSGDQFKTKIKDGRLFVENPFKLFDVLRVRNFKEEKKSKMIDGKWVKINELQKILVEWEVY